ncbi:MAG: hypothetical protein AMK72_08580 [Planctomycetes bacterium SM23_25]|nr:MAG: hypothetical protein AMK72_08580 [Planctomycetes bacterium SM23_25]
MRRTRLVFGCLLSIVLAGLPSAASAQPSPAEPPAVGAAAAEPPAVAATPAPPTPPAPTYPYTGYISADLVNIRSGPALYYYPLLTTIKGAPVVVEGEADNWLALRPPEGTYGLVRKGDLTIGASGDTATVSAPSARVYASSATAKRRWCVMATLKQGDTVRVHGPGEGDFVKIAPPESARVWVVDQYVAATSPTDPSLGQRPPVPIDIQPPASDPLVEASREAENGLAAELAKEIGDRNFDDVTAKFRQIAEKAEEAYLKNAARRHLARIAAEAERTAEYVRVTSLPDKLDEQLANIKTGWANRQAEAKRDEQLLKSDFIATGCLAMMESLEGVDHPVKFKLVDQNNHPLVVLQSTAYDLGKYLGKIIGVRGTKTYLKEWRIYLVAVDELEVVEE